MYVIGKQKTKDLKQSGILRLYASNGHSAGSFCAEGIASIYNICSACAAASTVLTAGTSG